MNELKKVKASHAKVTAKNQLDYFDFQIKQLNEKSLDMKKAIDNLNKQKASIQEMQKLERSVDKQMAISLYNDMQLYVDESMNQFYQKFLMDTKLKNILSK